MKIQCRVGADVFDVRITPMSCITPHNSILTWFQADSQCGTTRGKSFLDALTAAYQLCSVTLAECRA